MGAGHENRNSVAAHNVLSGYFNLETWVGKPWEQQLQDNELLQDNESVGLNSLNSNLKTQPPASETVSCVLCQLRQSIYQRVQRIRE